MADTEHKGYYAIIPATVRYDDNITPNAKLLYGEITALCNEKGYCWATNTYFANLYGVSERAIREWINQLIEGGYISRELIYKPDTKEIEKRIMRLTQEAGNKTSTGTEEIFHRVGNNSSIPAEQNFHRGMEEIFLDNNTIINNTNNNTLNNTTRGAKAPAVYFPQDESLNKAFAEYVKMRKQIKAPMTERAIELAITKLNKLSGGDNDKAIAILDQSIMNSWKGLFELKEPAKKKEQGIADRWAQALKEVQGGDR